MRRAVIGYESSGKGEMVMKKLLSIITLLMATSMLFWFVGCGGDDDDDDTTCDGNIAPTVTLSPAGGSISSTTKISATCSEPVETLTVSTGATATPDAAKKVWTFSLAEGNGQAVTVTATDVCEATGEASGTYDVGAPDTTAPKLVGNSCDPKDGADGVDPADVEEIVLVFDEALSGAEITDFQPSDAKIDTDIDGDTLTISFLGGWSLGNEMEVSIEVSVEDTSNNTADITYSFTTMAKE
jgi:hypothetical protein